MKSFLCRNPVLKPKKAKNISVNQAVCTNPVTLEKFFIQYKEVCRENGIDLPLYIWNYDKSGVQDIPKEDEVIGVKGEKAETRTF